VSDVGDVTLAVVGGGISGLAAAWEGVQRGADVVVLEASDRAGGVLATSPLGDFAVDEAADAFLARVPEAVELCRELGLGDDLVAPATGSAYVWSGGALRRLPAEQLLGVPTDLEAVGASGILSPAGLARAQDDLTRPDDRPDGDEAVGALVRRRLGDEVLDRLVAPLVGGIWAGDCDRLSLRTATPQLAAARDRGPSLLRAAADARAEALAAATAAGDRPVFLAPRGGMGRLVSALTEALGPRVRYGAPVAALSRAPGGRWRLEPAGVTADAVVLAVPAHRAAPVLADHAPGAAATLGAIDHATVALVALVVDRDAVGRALDGSGFLVPRSAGRLITACSWVSSKWAHLAGDGSSVVLRASAGHAGDGRAAALDDDALVAGVLADLRDLMDLRLRGGPVAVRVSRWPRSFPQPRPGHLDAVDAVDAELAAHTPGLAATGAWARGVGIPACIRTARAAAGRVLATVATA
jgi:oxygen-dependent protoporphyrinogen oxidase